MWPPQANNLVPLQLTFFKFFWPKTGLVILCEYTYMQIPDNYQRIFLHAHGNIEQPLRSCYLSRLIILHYNHYTVYYSKRIVKKYSVEENGEAAEAIIAQFLKRLMQ